MEFRTTGLVDATTVPQGKGLRMDLAAVRVFIFGRNGPDCDQHSGKRWRLDACVPVFARNRGHYHCGSY